MHKEYVRHLRDDHVMVIDSVTSMNDVRVLTVPGKQIIAKGALNVNISKKTLYRAVANQIVVLHKYGMDLRVLLL